METKKASKRRATLCFPVRRRVQGWCMAKFLSKVLRMLGVRKSDFGFECSDISLIAAACKLFALRPPRRAKSKVLHDERVVVLLLAFLVGPVIGADLRLKNELIALTRIFG